MTPEVYENAGVDPSVVAAAAAADADSAAVVLDEVD